MPDETVLKEIWTKENSLPDRLMDCIYLPMGKLRRSGELRELIAWVVRGMRLTSEHLGTFEGFPENLTEEQYVDALLANDAESVIQYLRNSAAAVTERSVKLRRKL